MQTYKMVPVADFHISEESPVVLGGGLHSQRALVLLFFVVAVWCIDPRAFSLGGKHHCIHFTKV